MGMTIVELTTMGAGYRALDEHLDALRRFRERLVRAPDSSSGVRR